MDIKLLRSFTVVARLEHIGQAAERLNISSSPLSRQIQMLEDELGVTLFHREKKRLHLTTEGEKFLDEVGPFLQHYDRLKDHARHLGQANAGRIDIGYVEAAIHSRLLPDALAKLALPPEIDIKLHSMRSKQQLEQLQARLIDVAFLYTLPPSSDAQFCQKIVLTEPVLLAMPKALALPAPTPAQLEQYPWIAEQENLNPAARAVTSGLSGKRLHPAHQPGSFRPAGRALLCRSRTGIHLYSAKPGAHCLGECGISGFAMATAGDRATPGVEKRRNKAAGATSPRGFRLAPLTRPGADSPQAR